MTSSIKNLQNEVGLQAIAKGIKDRIHDLEKTIESNQGRWAWELLQNAKDSVAEYEEKTVSVQIVLTEESVEFKHNGSHFQNTDIIGIINQVSYKEVEESEVTKKTGRFGTGFITTHLLSKVVEISGVVEDENSDFYDFEFTLDRRGKSTSKLIPLIRKTMEEYENSLSPIKSTQAGSGFRTSFRYKLDTELQRKVALVGIKEFSKMLPLVLAFIPTIDTVEIIDRRSEEHYISFKNKKDNPTGCIETILKEVDGNKEHIYILGVEDQDVVIATLIEKSTKGYCIKDISDFPKLFCDFPLIGTEDFPFPIIVNSFLFNPERERNGVWLKGEDDSEVKENRRILQIAVSLYKHLIAFVEKGDFFNIYNMASTRISKIGSRNISTDWHREHIQEPIRKLTFKANIVESEDDTAEKKAVVNIWFPDKALPKETQESLWEFMFEYAPTRVCKKEHMQEWQKLSWKGWTKVTYENFIKLISRKGNLSTLSKKLNMSEEDALHWLDSLGCFLLDEDKGHISLFEEYSFMPNKNGNFKERACLDNDKIQDEDLIYILELLDSDWNEDLLHEGITFFKSYIGDISKKDIAAEITESLKAVGDKPFAQKSSNSIKAIRLLSEWFETNSGEGEKLFSELYRNRAKMFMDTIEDKDSLYKVMRLGANLSKLAEVLDSDIAIVDKIHEAKELESILKKFKANSLSELEDMLMVAGNVLSDDSKRIEITEEVLTSLGVTSLKELEEALKDKDIAAKFIHSSTPEVEMFIAAQEKIARAKENVIKHLKFHSNYDCTYVEEVSPTVLGGIEKDGIQISIVVRPSDNKEVIIYYNSEKDTLDQPGAELWTDNGVQTPKLLTFGQFLRTSKITRIPVE